MPNQSIPGATTDAKPLKRSRKCEGSRLEADEQLSQHQLSTKGLSVPSKADEARTARTAWKKGLDVPGLCSREEGREEVGVVPGARAAAEVVVVATGLAVDCRGR